MEEKKHSDFRQSNKMCETTFPLNNYLFKLLSFEFEIHCRKKVKLTDLCFIFLMILLNQLQNQIQNITKKINLIYEFVQHESFHVINPVFYLFTFDVMHTQSSREQFVFLLHQFINLIYYKKCYSLFSMQQLPKNRYSRDIVLEIPSYSRRKRIFHPLFISNIAM